MTNEDAMDRAIALGEAETVRKLIAKDPEVLRSYVLKKSWLHWAAQEGNTEIMEVLVNAGLAIDQVTTDGPETPLETAAGLGHIEASKWLMNHGADINHGLGKSATPIFSAIYSKSLKLVELFVERSADLSATFGPPPQIDVISFAKEHGTPEIVSFLEKELRLPKS